MKNVVRGIRFTIVLIILLLAIAGSTVIVSADDNQTADGGLVSIPTEIVTAEPTSVPTDIPTITPTDVSLQTDDNTTVPPSESSAQTTVLPTQSPTPTLPVESLENGTDTPASPDSGNATSGLLGTDNASIANPAVPDTNSTDIPAITNSSEQSLTTNTSSPYDALVDPPLNTSSSNMYYDPVGKEWVINQSGVYYLDLSTSNNSGSGVLFDGTTNTFSNFGSGFGILINASNVILDGMGAIFDGGRNTQYGIIVNNQTAANYNTFSSDAGDALGGISITNITLTGFTQAGILFNNVLGDLPGMIATNITSNGAPASNVNVHDNTGNGIVLRNSQDIEVNNAILINNRQSGIDLKSSDSNTLTNNTATGNSFAGIYLEQSGNNNLNRNTATGNQIGIYLLQSGSNNVTGNNASDNWGSENIYIESSNDNTLTGNNASGDFDPRFSTTGILMHFSNNNILAGNTISGNNYYGIDINRASGNTFYNNYFNNANNVRETSFPGDTGNTWSITPTPGTNIIGGPNLGGNYWATPTGTGWSQTHTDIGGGFAVPFTLPGYLNSIDEHPLVTYIPPPTPPTGSEVPVLPSPTPPVLPQAYDASSIESTIPDSMKAGTSLVISITVHNNGTVQWNSETGVALDALPDATLFGPLKMYLPNGVTVAPGQDYTFTFTITAPSTPGTYTLEYQMSRNGLIPPGDLKFGDIYSKTITVTGNTATTGAVSAYQSAMLPKSTMAQALSADYRQQGSSDLVKSQAGAVAPATTALNTVRFTPF
jgi:parallel beta-helix repeat protein